MLQHIESLTGPHVSDGKRHCQTSPAQSTSSNHFWLVMRMANGLADFSLQLWLFGWNSYWWLQAMATFGCCIYATDRLAMATLSFSYCFSTYEKQWASWLWAEAALFSYPFIATWLWLHLAVLSQILPFLLLFHSLHFHVLSAVLTCMHYLMYFFLVICP